MKIRFTYFQNKNIRGVGGRGYPWLVLEIVHGDRVRLHFVVEQVHHLLHGAVFAVARRRAWRRVTGILGFIGRVFGCGL